MSITGCTHQTPQYSPPSLPLLFLMHMKPFNWCVSLPLQKETKNWTYPPLFLLSNQNSIFFHPSHHFLPISKPCHQMTRHLQRPTQRQQQKTMRTKVLVARKDLQQGHKNKVWSVHGVTHPTPNSATTITTASHNQGTSAKHVEDIGQKEELYVTFLLVVDAGRTRRWNHQDSHHVTQKIQVLLLQILVALGSFILFLLQWTFTLEGYPSLGYTIIITLQPLSTTSHLLKTLPLPLLLPVSTLTLPLPPQILFPLLITITTLFLTMVQSKGWVLWTFIVVLLLLLSHWVL